MQGTLLLSGGKKSYPVKIVGIAPVLDSNTGTSPAELEKLRNWLEHSNIGTTQQYLKFRMEEMRDMTIEGEI